MKLLALGLSASFASSAASALCAKEADGKEDKRVAVEADAVDEAAPASAPSPPAPRRWTLTFTGGLTNYALTSFGPRFGGPDRSWLETSARFGAVVERGDVKASVIGLAVKTSGEDPFGTGTPPPGRTEEAPAPSRSPAIDLDEAYLQVAKIAGWPLKLTVGRQNIVIGSQFLIGDGVYDGFAPQSQQAVYHNPRRSLDALRAEWDQHGTRFDVFVYRIDPTWDGGGERNGVVAGLDVSRSLSRVKGTYAAGLFYRHSRTDLDNDMVIVNVRAEQHHPSLDDLYLSGEVALESGTCRNVAYCTRVGGEMREWAWHAEAGYQPSAKRWKPFLELGYVYYSPDFTPVACGFSDWGKWYLGNQIDWVVFSTNTKVVRGAAGLWPHATAKVQLQYHHTREVRPSGSSTGGALSDEWSLIAEWYPSRWLWSNLLLGYARAGRALAASGLQNPFSALYSGAVPLSTGRSFDVVLAVGLKF